MIRLLKSNHPRRILIALALAVLLLPAGAAVAHEAELLKSDPSAGAVLEQAPERVTAWFNEELQTGPSTLQVFDAEGRQVDGGDGGVDLNDPDHASMIVSLPPLPDGVYMVRWHIVLEDGDATDGAFAFAVGAGEATVTQPSLPEPQAGRDTLPAGWLMVGAGAVVLVTVGWVVRRRQS